MPILPLDHPDPFSATLGVMLYPGTDQEEACKARAAAARFLAEPFEKFSEAGHVLSYEALARLLKDSGAGIDDIKVRVWGGKSVGELFKVLWALHKDRPHLASWNNAVEIFQEVAARNKEKGSRTNLMAAKSLFLSVAHLWGAWSLRGGRFEVRPDVGYRGYHDFHNFLAEAEVLRDWGQTWCPPRAKSKPFLPPEVWRVPPSWEPPRRKEGWPPIGRVHFFHLGDDLLRHLRTAGRPVVGNRA